MPIESPERDRAQEVRRELALVGAGLLLAGGLYVGSACPHVLGADNGEFATLYAEGGVSHPPGYPLYVLYLRAMSVLPAASAVLGAARATALLGALALALTYAACRAWAASPCGALVATATLGLGRVAFEQFTQAEAFALNLVLSAAFLAASGESSRVRGGARIVLLGALTGLGAAHHHTLATLAPIGVVAAVRALRAEGARPRHVVAAVAASAVGLSAYLYPVYVARHPAGRWVWGYPADVGRLVHLFLRWDYWVAPAARRAPGEQLDALGAGLVEMFVGVGLVLAAVGLAGLLWRRQGAALLSRAYGVALAASVALAGPFLLMSFTGRPIGVGRAVAERFYLLPALLLTVPFALGVDLLLARRARPWRWVFAALAPLVAYHVLVVRPAAREELRPTVDRYARNLLRSVPEGGVVVGTGDARIFSVMYMQHANAIRRDVIYTDAGMMTVPWYRTDVMLRLGDPAGGDFDLDVFADRVLGRGRTLFLTTPDFTVASRFALVPHGAVFQVVLATAPKPRAEDLEAENMAIARTFDWDDTPVKDHWSWPGVVEDGYRTTWAAVGQRYRDEGRQEDALRNALRSANGAQGPWAP